MPGIFNVPSAGLADVSVDEILDAIEKEAKKPVSEAVVADDAAVAYKAARDAAMRLLESTPEGPGRDRIRRGLRKLIDQRQAKLAIERLETSAQLDRLRHVQASVLAVYDWMKLAPKLERPQGSRLHKLAEAFKADRVVKKDAPNGALSPDLKAEWAERVGAASSYVIEHDWGAAFAGAGGDDFNKGEVRLPDDVCAFEFQITGRPIVAFATAEGADALRIRAVVEAVNDWWVLINMTTIEVLESLNVEDMQPLPVAVRTIRAVLVALDAEVAVTDVVRAPHKLNHARERAGKMPLFSYHVVSLARRSRVAPLPREDGEPAYHVRFHFRRGHWRHYEDHKTWIKWILVGDPDLGIVDKHYRL